MKKTRVYRHPNCAKCARFARVGRFLDWFHRVDFSTETPKTGPLRMGEVVVEVLSTGQIVRGVNGIELLWGLIPAYALFLPLLHLPSFRRYIDHEVNGCAGDACRL